ncbi:Protein of unknown function [Gryllus bimaculatus]|nr:Protein of unknown function [Gryllus bimaculatus]
MGVYKRRPRAGSRCLWSGTSQARGGGAMWVPLRAVLAVLLLALATASGLALPAEPASDKNKTEIGERMLYSFDYDPPEVELSVKKFG